jgi:hypothetical protein
MQILGNVFQHTNFHFITCLSAELQEHVTNIPLSQSSPSSLLSPLAVLDLFWQGKHHLPSSHLSSLHCLASHASLPPCLTPPAAHKKLSIHFFKRKQLPAFHICHHNKI